MIYIETNSEGKVVYINYQGNNLGKGFEINSIPEPEQIEGKVPVMYYRNGAIEYEYENLPPTPEPEPIPVPELTYKQQVVALIRERYDRDDESALERQRLTKPEEFEEYFAYCEECKKRVKQKLGML